MIGQSLGAYRVIDKLGEGGMGEVYRAVDTSLKREVALKVLPAPVAADGERIARFQREAELLAALNHPHIAAVYGLERSAGTTALVMELVDGDDLSVRIGRGPIPLDEAIPIARQLTEALEAAHEQGIVHRDLKPANVKVRPDGTVKVLDFGLAKALGDEPHARSGSAYATITSPAVTQLGVILGTAAYMAPEQARGKVVDRRADIWGFGCVLYEMLAGVRPFPGDDVTDLITTILRDEPRWDALPANIPSPVMALLRRCLEKDPRQRLRDIGEARIALESPQLRQTADAPVAATAGRARRILTGLACALAGAGLTTAALHWTRDGAVDGQPRAFEVVSGPDVRSPRVSPDGRNVVFVRGGRLFVRPLDAFEAREISGIQNASNPFWSPDSASIGYFAVKELRAVALSGGASRVLSSEAFAPFDAAWCRSGIVFVRWAKGLWIADEAGRVSELTPLDKAAGEQNLAYPSCLPDGRLLATALIGGDADREASAHIVTVDGRRTSRLFGLPNEAVGDPILVAPWHIVFSRSGANHGLWSVPVSPDFSAVTGQPTLVQAGGTIPSVSNDGLLVSLSGITPRDARLAWVDRSGRLIEQIGRSLGDVSTLVIAPDGASAALTERTGSNGTPSVWVHTANGAQRIADGEMLGWAPGGEAIAYGGRDGVYVRPLGAGAEPRRLLDVVVRTLSWTSDGKRIIYSMRTGDRVDIYVRSADGSDEPRTIATNADGPALSPNGRWLAYHADSGSGWEVFVASFPDMKRVWPVSTGRGRHPQWSTSGELFFAGGPTVGDDPNSLRDLYSVRIDPADGRPSTPVRLFDADAAGYRITTRATRAYGVASDGQRFLVRTTGLQGDAVVTAIQHVHAWLERLK
jgi:hypothetical protein